MKVTWVLNFDTENEFQTFDNPSEMSNLASKLCQIGPKWDKSGHQVYTRFFK